LLNGKWTGIIDSIDYAFQNIVNTATGHTFAVEALLRNYERSGFATPLNLFDEAYEDRLLFDVDIALREKAIDKFKRISDHEKMKLFYNYDPRILEMEDYRIDDTENLLKDHSLKHDQICLEINEKYRIDSLNSLNLFINNIKENGIKIALDDFGSGFAGFELFYYSDPDFLKFDRFLITGIDRDIRKKSFCSHIVNLCRILGVAVIAEGIETAQEFGICKEIGIDLVQGFFISQPQTDISKISYDNRTVKNISENEKRSIQSDSDLISNTIIILETINIDDNIKIIFEKFHDSLYYNFFPVLDSFGCPLGIIHERNIKKYVYSPYGKELLSNKSFTKNINKFITKIPIIDINTPQDRILEIFVNNPESEGVIITKNLKYFGFLNAKSLLNILNERNLSYAREINPLTKLPGNILINKYIYDCISDTSSYYYLIYFDFDYFKPFNDKFGFRQGDRIIVMFADILRKKYFSNNNFIGHIGGDDFFVGIRENSRTMYDTIFHVKNIIQKFNDQVVPFFSESEIKNGFYVSRDRDDAEKQFRLLSLSASIIEIIPGEFNLTQDDISNKLAELKKMAKDSEDGISISSIA
jgi:diguanylate cyclase (GGDEF)-like protein